jgi:hypothetical protein
MALEKYTGKSGSTVLTVGATAMPGWFDVTITENGRPLPTPMDVTDCQDSAYDFVDNPLGGETNPSSTVDVSGFLSVTDYAGAAGWLSLTKGNTYNVTVTTKTGGDEWTQTAMTFKEFTTGASVAEVMPFSAKFSHATASGAWSTDA